MVSSGSNLPPLTAAAATTAIVMYPVDVIRALKMASAGGTESFSVSGFIRNHGLKGLASQGAVAEVVKSSVMRVSKFFFFPLMCNGVFGKTASDMTPLQKGIAGSLATFPEIFMITPIEGAKLGLQTDSKKQFNNSTAQIMKHVYETRGVGGLWTGWSGMQLRNGLWTGTYFATLSSFKSVIEPPVREVGFSMNFSKKTSQGIAQFTAGFCAGTFAAMFNTPADVVRTVVTRRMFAEPNRKAHGISLHGVREHVHVARELFGKNGLRSLYPGFVFKSLHLGGSGALMALTVPFFAGLMGVKYDI